jgi:hypothetical protein
MRSFADFSKTPSKFAFTLCFSWHISGPILAFRDISLVIHLGVPSMARIFARILGLLFLLQGFAVGLVDGTRSIAAYQLDWTSFGALLNWLFPERIAAAATQVAGKGFLAILWDYCLTPLLPAPAIVLLFGLGSLLLIVARDRKAVA